MNFCINNALIRYPLKRSRCCSINYEVIQELFAPHCHAANSKLFARRAVWLQNRILLTFSNDETLRAETDRHQPLALKRCARLPIACKEFPNAQAEIACALRLTPVLFSVSGCLYPYFYISSLEYLKTFIYVLFSNIKKLKEDVENG